MSLLRLGHGQKAIILEIHGGVGIRERLMGLGVYPGKEITKESHIGLRGPVIIRIGRSKLALGHGMAEKVTVEAV